MNVTIVPHEPPYLICRIALWLDNLWIQRTLLEANEAFVD